MAGNDVLDVVETRTARVYSPKRRNYDIEYLGVGVDLRGVFVAKLDSSSVGINAPRFDRLHRRRIRVDEGVSSVNDVLLAKAGPGYAAVVLEAADLNKALSKLSRPLETLKAGDHVVVETEGEEPRMSRIYDTRKDPLTRDFAFVGATEQWYRTDGGDHVRGLAEDGSRIVSATTLDGSIKPEYVELHREYSAAVEAQAAAPEPDVTPEDKSELGFAGLAGAAIARAEHSGDTARLAQLRQLSSRHAAAETYLDQRNPHHPDTGAMLQRFVTISTAARGALDDGADPSALAQVNQRVADELETLGVADPALATRKRPLSAQSAERAVAELRERYAPALEQEQVQL